MALQDSYRPAERTAKHISAVTLGMIIGPTCVGKSTIIKEITALDPEFSVPGGFTTRELRSTDPKSYRHMDNNGRSLLNFLQRVKQGEPVQYYTYDTGHIYGSDAEDYPTPFSVLDTMYRSVNNLRQLGFKETAAIALTVSPKQYVRQLHTRFGRDLTSLDVKSRLVEAVKSLEWSLEEGDGVNWVINKHDQTEQTALEVIGIIRNQIKPNLNNRKMGEKLLKFLKQ